MPIATQEHTVPEPVRRVAAAALEHHKASPLEGVGGVGVAQGLASGRVKTQVLEKMLRFFSTRTKEYQESLQRQMTEDTAPLVRSWDLYGGDAGLAWAKARLKRAVESEGYLQTDEQLPLFSMHPDEVYEAFAMSGWKWEYNLTPKKAARFVEVYQRATGLPLDLGKAFGESATAVGNAIYRRYHSENPFETLIKALNVRDDEVQQAAESDLEILRSFERGLVTEGMLPKGIWSKDVSTQSKALWPVLVAYIILASESPKHLADANLPGKRPPMSDESVRDMMQYDDAVGAAINYFHPEGKRYSTGGNPKWAAVPQTMLELVYLAWAGKKIVVQPAKKTLAQARAWAVDLKLAGGVFQILLAHWNKANWAGILELIPPDADIYTPFKNFAGANPLTKGEMKLQQTLTDKKLQPLVAQRLGEWWFGSGQELPPEWFQKVKDAMLPIKTSGAAKLLVEQGTPIGVMSLVKAGFSSQELICLGYFSGQGLGVAGNNYFFFAHKNDPQLEQYQVLQASSVLKAVELGKFKVIQAHSDMPGTAYPSEPVAQDNNQTPAFSGEEPVSAQANSEAIEYLASTNFYVVGLPADTSLYNPVALKQTAAGKALKKAGLAPVEGQVYTFGSATPADNPDTQKPVVSFAVKASAKLAQEQPSSIYTTNDTWHILSHPIPGIQWSADFPRVVTDSQLAEFIEANELSPAAPSAVAGSVPPIPPDQEPAPTYTAPADQGDGVATEEPWLPNVQIGDFVSLGSGPAETVVSVQDTDEGRWVITQYWDTTSPPSSSMAALSTSNQPSANLRVYHSLNETAKQLKVVKTGGNYLNDLKPYFGEWAMSLFSASDLYFLSDGSSSVVALLTDHKGAAVQAAQDLPSKGSHIGWVADLFEQFWEEPASFQESADVWQPVFVLLVNGVLHAVCIGASTTHYFTYTQENYLADHTLATPDKPTWARAFRVIPVATLLRAAVSSYTPPEDPPETVQGDDVVDPEQGRPSLSNTPLALSYINSEEGLTAIAAPTDTPSAVYWGLGQRFTDTRPAYAGELYRIIGFAKGEGKVWYVFDIKRPGKTQLSYTHYPHEEVQAQVNAWEATDMGWSPVGVDQNVVNAGEATPEDKAKQKFPKLDYHLSKGAKEANEQEGWVFLPTTEFKDVPGALLKFKVGAHIQNTTGVTVRGRILGYCKKNPTADDLPGGLPWIVLRNSDPATRKKTPFISASAADINEFFELVFDYKAELKPGSATFGQSQSDTSLTVILNDENNTQLAAPPNKGLATPPEGFFESVPSVYQPPFASLPKGTHISAGVVALLPPKSVVKYLGVLAPFAFDSGVVLTRPKTAFGGYTLGLPKGTIEKGEGIELGAVREVYEETGFLVKPVAYLGDFKTNTSITRMFVGTVVGGSGYTGDDSETDATVIRDLVDYEKWKAELIPDSGSKWQQEAIEAAMEWVAENGDPMAATSAPSASGKHSQVTLAGDSDDALPAQDYVNKSLFDWMQLNFPYPVTTAMRVALEKAVMQRFGKTAQVSVEGMESELEFGKVFTAKGYGDSPVEPTPYTFVGYVWVQGYTPEGELDDNNLRHYAFGINDSAKNKVALVDLTENEYLLDFKTPDQPTPQSQAWFTHPDEAKNQMILAVYQSGGLPGSGLSLAKMRKFLKEAGVPNAQTMPKSMAYLVASLFVPGKTTQTQYDLLMLKLSGAKGFDGAGLSGVVKPAPPLPKSTATPPEPIPVAPAPATALKQIIKLNVDSPLYAATIANPDPTKFTGTGKHLSGGSKPNQVLDGPGGQYFFKTGNPGDPFSPAISTLEAAFYTMIEAVRPGGNIPVGVMEFEGQVGTLQALANPVAPPPANPNNLSDENKAYLLSQHAFDMFIGDHDGHAGNLLMVEGQLRAIDKGQGLRFLVEGAKESLDPTFHDSKRNLSGAAYAKKLLIAWGKNESEIPLVAFEAMHKTVLSIKAIYTEKYLTSTLGPAFDLFKFTDEKRQDLIQKLVDRASTYDDDWLKVLKKLRADFKWPGGTTISVNPSLEYSPRLMEFGEEQEQDIQEAVDAGWQGKALRIDRNYIEAQEVVVKAVQYKGAPATLAFWKMTYEAGAVVDANLLNVSEKMEVSPSNDISTSNRLSIDVKNQYFDKIRTAVGNLNYHLAQQNDINVNAAKIDAALALKPELQELYDQTSGKEGIWKDTGLPAENIYQMATAYLNHIATIEFVYNNLEDHLGKMTKWLDPYEVDFDAQEEKPEIGQATIDSLPFKSKYITSNAVFPKTTGTSSAPGVPLQIQGLNEISFSQGVPQYQIEDNAGAKVFIVPTSEKLVKVRGRRGHCWGFITEAPSSASVSHILRLFEVATKIQMKPATQEDREAMYWMRQAHILQTEGSVIIGSGSDEKVVTGPGMAKPKSGTADTTLSAEDKAIRETYRSGDSAAAAAAARKLVAERLGVPEDELESLPGYEPDGILNNGAGRRKQVRLGWDRARLQKVLGSDVCIVHKSGTSLDQLFTRMSQSGPVLLANEERVYGGVTPGAGSKSAPQDFGSGGSQGVFTCFRSLKKTTTSGYLCFDISLALRTDAYFVGTGDTYGNIEDYPKVMGPDVWAQLPHRGNTGDHVASGSHYQFNVRYDIDLREYLVKAICSSQTMRKAIIDLCNKQGWVFKWGSPEDIFVVS